MNQIAAKLAGPDIAPPRAARSTASVVTAAPSLPAVAVASIALHGLIALGLVGLPLSTQMARELDTTWVDFDFVAPAAAPVITPEPVIVPEPEVVPAAPVVRHERPQPIAEPEPEPTPSPEVFAPPSLEEAFAEPAPLAAAMTAEGASGFSVAPGEVGGDPNGAIGGHGTARGASVRPAAQDVDPSDADRRRARRGYVHAIEELVRAHARYPRSARGTQGRVELALRVGNDGHVLNIRLATTSGDQVLDTAALEAAREIDRVPAPPLVASLSPSDEVRVGVVYRVR